MNSKLYDAIFRQIVDGIELKNSKDLYAIAFIGGPCTGKSTISKTISSKLGIPVLINDQIRRILEKYNIDPEINRDIVMNLSYDRIKYMLDNRVSMIIDANALSVYSKLNNLFNDYKAKLFVIELKCSEKEIHRRLIYRENNYDENNYSRATTKDYKRIIDSLKPYSIDKKNIFFTINTEENLDMQVSELIDKINNV